MGSTQPPIQWVPEALSAGAKVAEAWSWPLTSSKHRGQENVDLYIHSPILLHDVVLNSLSTRTNVPFFTLASNWDVWSGSRSGRFIYWVKGPSTVRSEAHEHQLTYNKPTIGNFLWKFTVFQSLVKSLPFNESDYSLRCWQELEAGRDFESLESSPQTQTMIFCINFILISLFRKDKKGRMRSPCCIYTPIIVARQRAVCVSVSPLIESHLHLYLPSSL
jgi:hypothetical protein